MTKKQQGMKWMYDRATANSLNQVYKSCSYAKQRSFDAIRWEMVTNGGYDLRITGHNAMMYSCAYRYKGVDGLEHLRYFTKANTFDFPIN